MKLIPVLIKGKIHRLSERALELLNLEKIQEREITTRPISMQKLPPNLEILKIQKAVKEEQPVLVAEKVAERVVEVKKKEDVTVESTAVTKKKRVKKDGKVGTKK